MAKQKQIRSTRKKNPTPQEVMADMKMIGHKFGVYLKECDPFSDYFADKITQIKSYYHDKPTCYYYATRLEALAYRHERAKRYYSQNQLRKVG